MKKLFIVGTLLLLITTCFSCSKYKNDPFINKDNGKDMTVAKARKALSDGANINAKDYRNATSLMYALQYTKDSKVIQLLLKFGAKIDVRTDIYKRTPLMLALQADQSFEVIKLLLNAGAKANDEDHLHLTPLNFALKNSTDHDVIKLLLSKGATVSVDSLRNAILSHQPFEIIDLLQKAGAKPITQAFFNDYHAMERYQNYHGKTPKFTDLINAVKTNRSLKVINLLLKAGSKVNRKDKGEMTALMSAMRYEKHIDVIKALIQAGSQVNYNMNDRYTRDDHDTNTPLKSAIKYKQPLAVINMLIKAGAKMRLMDSHTGYTLLPPLMYALKISKNDDIIRALLKAKAPLRYKDDENYNETPLNYAIEYNQSIAVVKMLIKAGAKVNRKISSDGYAVTPLNYASTHPKNPHSFELIKLFIQSGAKDLNTSFLQAIDSGQAPNVIKLFLKSGVQIKKFKPSDSPLIHAVVHAVKGRNNVEIIQLLLKAGVKINVTGEGMPPILAEALDNQDSFDVIQALLKAGAYVNPRSEYATPLLKALDKKASIETIQALLKHGAHVLVHYSGGETPFNSASNRKDSIEVNKLLIKYLKAQTHNSKAFLYEYNAPTITVPEIQQAIKNGSNINGKNEYHQLPIFLAIKFNRPKILQALLKNGAKHNIILNFTNHLTPLMFAIDSDKPELTKILLENGANINTKDGNKRSPLFMALTDVKDLELIQLLLKHGAQVNTKDTTENQPLILAINHDQNPKIIQALLQAGAKVNIQDQDCNQTPLIYAIGDKRSIKTVKLLLNAGANPNFKDCNGYSPTLFAVKNRPTDLDKINVVKLLIKAGANTNIVNTKGEPILGDLIENNASTGLIQTIINGGADVKQKFKNGNPLLMYMITDDRYLQNLKNKEDAKHGLDKTMKIINMFVKAGADINAKNAKGQNLLISTIIHDVPNDSRTIVLFKLLIKLGADVNIADNQGKTPLMYVANMTYNSKTADSVQELYNSAHMFDGIQKPTGNTEIDILEKHYNTIYANLSTIKETIIHTLIAHKAHINDQDKQGHTPLFYAKRTNSSDDVINMLSPHKNTLKDLLKKSW